MTIDEAVEILKWDLECMPKEPPIGADASWDKDHNKLVNAFNMAIEALGMQEKLIEYKGCDICEWVEDYDYDEHNISAYQGGASVDEFLIDEVKGGE